MTLTTDYPILYKRSHSWQVQVRDNYVQITHGPVYGNKQVEAIRTPSYEDAQIEAQRRWDHKVNRESYGDTPYYAPLTPMLAVEYETHKDKLPPTVYVQPKLDGIRCVADNSVLMSRRNSIICSVPHIKQELSQLPDGIKLDGELYIHGLSFQEHLEYIKRDTPHPEFHRVEYHVFDIQSPDPFYFRHEQLKSLILSIHAPSIHLVPTIRIKSTEVTTYRDSFLSQGYEGAMVRDPFIPYEYGARSFSLQKYKREDDSEFPIVGWTAAKTGRERGCAIVICSLPNGETFTARMTGTLEYRRSLMQQPPPILKSNPLMARIKHYGFFKTGIPKMPRCDSFFYGKKL